MANITVQDINHLRKITGVGLMDCKQALIEADGNIEKAIEILRKKGQKVANKRADRETNEGVIIAKTNKEQNFGAIFILTCETDFVARGEDFINSAYKIMDTAIQNKCRTVEELLETKLINENLTVGDLVNELLSKIQEKIQIANYETFEAPYISVYNHHNHRVSAIVLFNKVVNDIEEIGKEIAMQISAMAPVAVDEKTVPQEIIDKELEIARELTRQENKPEDMIEKIAQGKLNKFFKENTLLNQELIKDNKMTVKQYLNSFDKELTVLSFKRLAFA